MEFEIAGKKDGPQEMFLTYEKDGRKKSILLPDDAAERIMLRRGQEGYPSMPSCLREILLEPLPREEEDRPKAKEVMRSQPEQFDALNWDVFDRIRD